MIERLLYKRESFTDKDSIMLHNIDEMVGSVSLFQFNQRFRPSNDSIKRKLYRVLMAIITNNRAKVMVITSETSELIHYAYIVPRCIIYPFIGKNDYEIGPCRTEEAYRNKGYYKGVLNYIQNVYRGGTLYMLVEEDNRHSIQGIESSGFLPCGKVRKHGFRWKIVRD